MIEVRLEGCIYELNFGYNTKMEGYTNISSVITGVVRNCGRHKIIGEVKI